MSKTPRIETLFRLPLAECGEVTARAAQFPKHTHDEYVLSANLSGHERIWYGGRSADVQAGQVTLYNPLTVQASEFGEADTRFVSLHLDAGAVRVALAECGSRLETPAFAEGVLDRPGLFRAILALRTPGTPAETEEACQVLLDELSRLGAAPSGRPEPEHAARLVAFMRDNLYEPIGLDDLSAWSGLSRFHLVRSFKAAMSLPPMQFLKQLRLIEARRRLRRGDAVVRVAHELHFYDQGHLGNAFRRAIGLAPGRYAALAASGATNSRYPESIT